eukprot:Nk52_evm12s2340 gene=Nk52_evmTU12s2340
MHSDEAASSSKRGSIEKGTEKNARRATHIAAEQKRRAALRDKFEDLRSVIPTCNPHDPKAVILTKAKEFIVFLKGKGSSSSSNGELEEIQKRLKFAVEYIKVLDAQKAALLTKVEELGGSGDVSSVLNGQTKEKNLSYDLNKLCTETLEKSGEASEPVDIKTKLRQKVAETQRLNSMKAEIKKSNLAEEEKSKGPQDELEEDVLSSRSLKKPRVGPRRVVTLCCIAGLLTMSLWPSDLGTLYYGSQSGPESRSNMRTLQSVDGQMEQGVTSAFEYLFFWRMYSIFNILFRMLGILLAVCLSWQLFFDGPGVLAHSKRHYLAMKERKAGNIALSSPYIEIPERHFLNALAYLGCSPLPTSTGGLLLTFTCELLRQLTHLLRFGLYISKYTVRYSSSEEVTEEQAKAYYALNQLYFGDPLHFPLEGWVCLLKALNLAQSLPDCPVAAMSYASISFQLMFNLSNKWYFPAKTLSMFYRMRGLQTMRSNSCQESDKTKGWLGLMDAWGTAAFGRLYDACECFKVAKRSYENCGLYLMAWEANLFHFFSTVMYGDLAAASKLSWYVENGLSSVKTSVGMDMEQAWWAKICRVIEKINNGHASYDAKAIKRLLDEISEIDSKRSVDTEVWRDYGNIRAILYNCLVAWYCYRLPHNIKNISAAVSYVDRTLRYCKSASPIAFGVTYLANTLAAGVLTGLLEKCLIISRETSGGNSPKHTPLIPKDSNALAFIESCNIFEHSSKVVRVLFQALRNYDEEAEEIYCEKRTGPIECNDVDVENLLKSMNSLNSTDDETTTEIDGLVEKLITLLYENQRQLREMSRSFPFVKPRSLLCRGLTYRLLGDRDHSTKLLKKALVCAKEMKMPMDDALARLELSKLLMHSEPNTALSYLNSSIEDLSSLGLHYYADKAQLWRSSVLRKPWDANA